MTIIDEGIRKEILQHKGSLIVRANAGSGKTTIMVKKIKSVLEGINDHRTVAAITFTNKATNEIKNKYIELGGKDNFLISTNDAFIESEIIRPFINDAHRNKFVNFEDLNLKGIDLSLINFDCMNLSEFSNDYTSNAFYFYGELLNNLIINNRLSKYKDNKKNFKFELAMFILNNSIACQEYIKYKYEMIFIDEYQDSDIYMHNFFVHINQVLGIKLFIVGDVKQAIYLWRGAQNDIFKLLPNNIEEKTLIHNFRSLEGIFTYANAIHDPKSLPLELNNIQPCIFICNLNLRHLGDLINSNNIDRNKSITIIVRTNQEAILYRTLLEKFSLEFEYVPSTPLDENQSEHTTYLKAIANYFFNQYFSVFDFVNDFGLELSKSQILQVKKILDKLMNLFPLSTNINFDRNLFTEIIVDLNTLLEITITQNEVELLFNTLSNRNNRLAFIPSNNKFKIMTIFSAKGLEFDQVIGFCKNYDFKNINEINNHYVLITRAKEKVFMINDDNNIYKNSIDKIIQTSLPFLKTELYKCINL